MGLHLPGTSDSWREIAKDILVVVIGVLLALFAQQLVDRGEWRQKVGSTRAAMRDELLSDDGPQIYQRAAMHPCVVARLDAIRAAVESGRGREQISRLIDVYWLPFRTYDSLALDAAMASDVASHMPQDELQAFTAVYERMPSLDRTNAQEAADLARLQAFRRTGGAISDAEKDRLLGAVEALRNDDRMMWTGAVTKLPQLRKLGELDAGRVQGFMDAARQHYGTCIRELAPDFPTNLPNAL